MKIDQVFNGQQNGVIVLSVYSVSEIILILEMSTRLATVYGWMWYQLVCRHHKTGMNLYSSMLQERMR
jgi:hypothetical protein